MRASIAVFNAKPKPTQHLDDFLDILDERAGVWEEENQGKNRLGASATLQPGKFKKNRACV